jgi:predicted PurR-regulated permease PerM
VLKTVVILAVCWLLFALRDLVLIVVTAVVLASAIEPGAAGLVKRKLPRTLAVILVYLMVFALFFVVFYFFIPSLFGDFSQFAASLPGYLSTFTQTGSVGSWVQTLGIQVPASISSADVMTSIGSVLNINGIFANVFTLISAVFGGVFSFVLIIVLSFYFAVVETGVDDFLRLVMPKEHEAYALGLWRRSQHKIGLWMQGQVLLALIMGILVYLGLTILGVPHALVLAVIAATCEIIPVFGPTLSAVPAVAVALASGGLSLGLLTVALFVIAQQFENHLIYPLVVTRVVGVPPLLVIIALIAGAELAGFLGIILSVPVAATLRELAHDLSSGRLRREVGKS